MSEEDQEQEQEHSQENYPQHSEENEEHQGVPEELIDQAGETIFQNIYKDVEKELKDQIITKLLNKLQEQGKKIEELEKENRKLKDDYTYVLKRILVNKNDYISTNNSNNKKNGHFTTDNSNRLNNSAILTNKKNHINISEDWDASEEESLDNKSKHDKQSIDNKIKRYLNNLNKKNYVNTTDGTSANHYIEKDIALYDELFPKKSYITGINSSFEGSAPDTKRNASVKNRKPKIGLYFKEYKNSVLDKKEESSKNRGTSKKKIKIYRGANNSNLKSANTAQNKPKNIVSYTAEDKKSAEKKTANKKNRGNHHYNKAYVVNSNDTNRKLKLHHVLGNKGHVSNLAKQSTK